MKHWNSMSAFMICMYLVLGTSLARAQQPPNEVQLPQSTTVYQASDSLTTVNSLIPMLYAFSQQWNGTGISFGDDASGHLFAGLQTSLVPPLKKDGITALINENHVLNNYYYSYNGSTFGPGSQGSTPAADMLADFNGLQFDYQDTAHGEDYTQQTVLTNWKNILNEAHLEGFTEYYADDFGWPYKTNSGTSDEFGYGAPTVTAFQGYLSGGTDPGLIVNDGNGSTKTLTFWTWLKLYTDFVPTPADAGCTSWSSYVPVAETGSWQTSVNYFLFNALQHYATDVFLQEGGSYGASLGLLVTPTLNGENIANCVDYYTESRLNGVEKIGLELGFNSPRFDLYHDARYINGNAQKYGHRLAAVGEIGVGGDAPAYETWDSAYAHYYDQAAGLNVLDYNNQYVLSNWGGIPPSNSQFPRVAAWYAGALAIAQLKAENEPVQPIKSTVLVDQSAVLEIQNQYDDSSILQSLHYPFDRVSMAEFCNYIQNANVVVYCPAESSPEHFTALTNWLNAGSGRTLITSTFVPFQPTGGAMQANEAASTTGLGLAWTSVGWGYKVTLPAALGGASDTKSVITLTSGTVLLSSTEGYPLITQQTVQNTTNQILYVNVDFSQNDAFDSALAQYVMTLAGAYPDSAVTNITEQGQQKDIHLFPVPGGHSSVIWDDTDLQNNQETANGGSGYYQRELVPATTIVFNHCVPNASYTMYDFFNGAPPYTQTASASGTLTYTCNDSVDIVYYGLTNNNTAFNKTLTAIQATESALQYVNPNSGLGWMPNPIPVPSRIVGGSVPSPWVDADIGSPGIAGSANSTDGSKFDMNGGGSDAYGSSDQCNFCYQVLPADGTIVARVTGIQPTSPYAKAGLMIRSSLSASSYDVALEETYSKGLSFQYRNSSYPSSSSVYQGTTSMYGTYWIELVRSGGTVTAYTASDLGCVPGTWTQIGSPQPIAAGTAYAGLFVTAVNNSQLNFSQFDHVSFSQVTELSYNASALFNNDAGWPGNGPQLAYDDSTSSVFCSLAGTGAYTGIDLGQNTFGSVASVYYYPRSDSQANANRMEGGIFEGSNNQTSGYTTFYTVPSTTVPLAQWSYGIVGGVPASRYLRWRNPGNYADVAEIQFVGFLNKAANVVPVGYFSNDPLGYQNTSPSTWAFDGNTNTTFCSSDNGGDYTGVDLGAGNAKTITTISYWPRSDAQQWANRMEGGVFEGSNNETTGYTTLYKVPSTPPAMGQWTTVNLASPSGPYRYLRWRNPSTFADVNEIQFIGY